jgi:hypothetical protein
MGNAVNIGMIDNNNKKVKENKFNEISEKQKQGLNPLTEGEISDAEKNTSTQRFREMVFGKDIISPRRIRGITIGDPSEVTIGGGINQDLESRYQRLTANPEYSESTNAFRSQMALRKSRQTSTRLGG